MIAKGRLIKTTARGYQVLRDLALNKGTAFSAAERRALGLDGLLPPVVTTELEPQLERAYAAYRAAPTDLAKHIYMWRLHDNNVTLFYALLQRHMLEMLPVVYDPVVGEAIENYSEVMTRPRGVFLSIDDPDIVEKKLADFGAAPDEIDLLVASDAEEILGIGDWGSNGIDISIGKLAVYTAAAGVDPHRVVPVVLDVGTDNEKLLNDPLYVGYRHGRIRGKAYDDFIDAYVTAATKLFPSAMLHWEDFGSTNCRRILGRYRDKVPTFNDDMQGTGAIVLAGLLNAVARTGGSWTEQRVVVFGAGTAGVGIADQIRDQMVRHRLVKGRRHAAHLARGSARPADGRHDRRSARLPTALCAAARGSRRPRPHALRADRGGGDPLAGHVGAPDSCGRQIRHYRSCDHRLRREAHHPDRHLDHAAAIHQGHCPHHGVACGAPDHLPSVQPDRAA